MNFNSAREAVPALFSNSYAEAREKFLAASEGSRPYQCSATGPDGATLFTDVSYYGPTDATNLLVLISATHGPEGYCGSAGQLAFLYAGLHHQLPLSTGVLLIHALNCYGFAWDRRSTAEGCDLNRNFIDFDQPLPSNPGYEELAQYLVPPDISLEGLRDADARIAAYRADHGEHGFQKARMSGQFSRPGGLFYGGTAPTEARQTLEQIALDYKIAERERVVIVDYHTGQGRYGYGELMCEQPSGLAGFDRATKIFGPSATSPDLGTSTSVALNGTLDEFWQRILGDRHTYVALEFGTYTNLSILRNEHWLFLHRPDEIDTEVGRSIRAATKNHYYPHRDDWREMILWRADQVHHQALDAFRT